MSAVPTLDHEILELMRKFMLDMRDSWTSGCTRLGISAPAAHVMTMLEHGSHPMRDLAAALNIGASYVTALVDSLEADGLAVRQADPNDRRVRVIEITDRGRLALTDLFEDLANSNVLLARLTLDERKELRNLLARCLRSE